MNQIIAYIELRILEEKNIYRSNISDTKTMGNFQINFFKLVYHVIYYHAIKLNDNMNDHYQYYAILTVYTVISSKQYKHKNV